LLLPSGENVEAMAPNPAGTGSSAERQYHGANNGKAVVAKMPGTPHRRDTGGHGHSREKAVQDPGLKDYVGASLPPPAVLLSSFEYRAYDCPSLAEVEVTAGDFDIWRLFMFGKRQGLCYGPSLAHSSSIQTPSHARMNSTEEEDLRQTEIIHEIWRLAFFVLVDTSKWMYHITSDVSDATA
jgi:hypothetical protein